MQLLLSDPEKLLPLVRENYLDLMRSEKVFAAWVKHFDVGGKCNPGENADPIA